VSQAVQLAGPLHDKHPTVH